MELKQYLKSKRGLLVTIIYLMIVCIYIIEVNFFPKFEEINIIGNFFTSYTPEVSISYMMLLIWFLPIWIYQMYIYIIQTEFNRKSSNILISKRGFKKNYFKKLISSFYIVFCIMFVICISSIFMTYFFGFIAGIDLNIDLVNYYGNEILESNNLGVKYEVYHPLLSIITHYITLSFCAGLIATVMTSLTFAFKNMKVTLIISIIWWYYFISSSKFNIMLVIQPFIYSEYSLNYSLETLLFFIISVLLINFIAYLYIMRKDNV